MSRFLVLVAGALAFATVPQLAATRNSTHQLSGSAQVLAAKRIHMRHVLENRRVAWRWQDRAGMARSPRRPVRLSMPSAHLRWLVRLWHARAYAAMRVVWEARPVVDGCLWQLVSEESGWNVTALNPSTGAYGLPQALPGSKMASAGADWATNPATQIRWMVGYVKGRYGRYGGSCAALAYKHAHGYY